MGWRAQWLGLGLSLAACSGGGLELFVDLKTDLVAGVEFHEVRVRIDDAGAFRESLARAGTPFDEGLRVAEFDGLKRNPARVVRVELLDDRRRIVAERSVIVQHTVSRSLTVLITRDCRDVSCPSEQTCYGGRCVEPECLTGAEPSCPAPECVEASDCAAMDACASARCEGSVCVYLPAGRCGAGEYCDPAVGCRPLPAETDAGSGDAGPGDAAVMLPAPAPHWPPNGHPTGSVHADPSFNVRRPTFRWRAVSGAGAYRIQVTDDCPAGDFASCTFASLTWDVFVLPPLLEFQPPEPLAVSETPPVGTRYFWRVRACTADTADGGCGPWSAVRYVDVGRLSFDVDGDGYDDVVAGGREGAALFRGGSAGVSTTSSRLTNPLSDATASFGSPIAFGDVDADGFRDVLVGAESDRGFGSIVLYRGGLSGLGAPQVFENPPTSGINGFFGRRTDLADVDGDGYADLLASSVSQTWWYRGGASVADDPMPVGGEVARVLGDVDGDGYADAHVFSSSASVIAYGSPTGPMVRSTEGPSISYSYGDLDGDGWLEFGFWLSPTRSRLVTSAGGSLASAGEMDAAMGVIDYQVGAVVDADGDGDGDVWAGWGGMDDRFQGAVWFVPFDGRTPGPAAELVPCHGPCRISWALTSGADFNGDGLGDAAVGFPVAGGVAIFLGGSPPSPAGVLSFGIEDVGRGL